LVCSLVATILHAAREIVIAVGDGPDLGVIEDLGL
jgi:hypothetical protein